LSPLLAFTGIGRDVTDTHPDSALGALKTWKPATNFKQLFISGLQDANRRLAAMGRAGMHYRRSRSLVHWIDRQIDAAGGTAAAPAYFSPPNSDSIASITRWINRCTRVAEYPPNRASIGCPTSDGSQFPGTGCPASSNGCEKKGKKS
jgi:hypothetical protein